MPLRDPQDLFHLITNRGADLGTALDNRYQPHTASKRVPRPKLGQVLTTFASGHGWTQSVSGTANDDTSIFVRGSQSFHGQTAGGGAQMRLGKVAYAAKDWTGKQIVIQLRITNSQNLPTMTFYAGDTGMTNFYFWNLSPTTLLGDDKGFFQNNTWQTITLNWQDASTSASPTRSALTDYRLMLTDDNTGVKCDVWINLLADTPEPKSAGFFPGGAVLPNGCMCVGFDDGYSSVYNTARPVMDANGQRADVFVIQDLIGKSNRMTLQNLRDLRDRSHWGIQAHANTVADHDAALTTLSADDLETDLSQLHYWGAANGFPFDGLAYPNGSYTETMLDSVRRYYAWGRTFYERNHETFPPADPYRLRCRSVDSTTTTGQVQGWVDNAYANGGVLLLLYHDIVTSPTLSSQHSTANFTTESNYWATKGIPVLTINEMLAIAP